MSSNELPVLSLDEARMNRAAWAESNLQTLDLSIDPIEQLLAPAEGDHLIHASPRSTVIALALKMTFLFPQLAAAKLRTRAPEQPSFPPPALCKCRHRGLTRRGRAHMAQGYRSKFPSSRSRHDSFIPLFLLVICLPSGYLREDPGAHAIPECETYD